MNIYLITNIINGRKYVGLTTKPIEERFKAHKYAANLNQGYYLHNAMRKYGVDNFKIELIDTADSIDELKEKEIFNIEKYDTFNTGYNLTIGGDYTANAGKVTIKDMNNNNISITVDEFRSNPQYTHVNKNMITIFKDDIKLRVTSLEYKNKYYDIGFRSKNYGRMNVIDNENNIIQLNSTDFDPNIHKGINSGKQMYYNSILHKYELLTQDEVDINIHYTKNRCRYIVKDSNNKIVQICLNIDNILDENGFKQFRYLQMRDRKFNKLTLSEEVMNKLKFKNQNKKLIGYTLIREKI